MSERGDAISFDVVVAADLDGGIGRGGGVPWRLPSDLGFFKRLTSETSTLGLRNAVVMGRVTWDSLPPRFRPLPGRQNLVVTRQADLLVPPEVVRASSLDEALAAANRAEEVERIFVIGGGQLYRQAFALDGLANVYLTRVLGRFDCDTELPPLPPSLVLAEVIADGRDGELGYRIGRWAAAADQ